MTDLHRATIFLSASFPSGNRGERFRPYDPSGIADAVSAFTRAILSGNGKLVFGGHPTITPLVLMIARELSVTDSVIVFQSAWFRHIRIPEVDEIQSERLGVIHWTKSADDLERSLRIMRNEMIGSILMRPLFLSAEWKESKTNTICSQNLGRTFPAFLSAALEAPPGHCRATAGIF